jgi:hypothetical protein
MKARIFFAAVALAPFMQCAAADIYRCATPGGGISYQELPCHGVGAKTDLPTNFPEVNIAARETLLQREAALERRLEAQRERLSREEMTRITARAQVAAAEATVRPVAEPVYLAGWPPGVSRWRHRPAASGTRRTGLTW